jgi:hypothetical protein
VATAARLYQTVMEDPSMALFYGDDDLTFIRKIQNPKVVLTLVKQVRPTHTVHTRFQCPPAFLTVCCVV